MLQDAIIYGLLFIYYNDVIINLRELLKYDTSCYKYTYKNLLAHIYTIYSLLLLYIAQY